MKKRLVIGTLVVLACATVVWVQEYEPDTILGTSKRTVFTVVGHRTVIDSTVPYRSNDVTYASVARITTAQLVRVQNFENDVLVSESPIAEMNYVSTMDWYMAQTNAQGEVRDVPIKPGGAAKFWRAWKNSQPVPGP